MVGTKKSINFAGDSGRSAVRLAHLLWEQGVEGSNPFTPTNIEPRTRAESGEAEQRGQPSVSGNNKTGPGGGMVDALVSGASAARRAGSSPVLGTLINCK